MYSTGGSTSQIAHGTIFVFVATFVGLGINYLYGIFLARCLGANAFGLYSLGLSIFNILALLSVMGLDNAVLRFIPKAFVSGDINKVRSLIKTTIVLGVVAGSLMALMLVIGGPLFLTKLYDRQGLGTVLKSFALAVPAFACATILFSIMQALHDVRWRMSIKYILEPISKFLLTVFLVLCGWELNGALTAFIVALWLSMILGFIGLKKIIPLREPKEKAVGEYPWRHLISYSLPLLVGMLFNVIASRFDILFLGYHVSTEQVGIYAAAFQTAAIMGIVLQSVESIIAPILSERIAHGSRNDVREIYTLAIRWAMILGLSLFVPFLLFSEEILGFYGSQFKEGAIAFVFLAVGQFINLATGSANYILLLSGKSKLVMANGVAYACLQVALNVILVPIYGILGSAIAMLCAFSTVNLLRLGQVYFLLRIHPYQWELVKPLSAGIIVFLFLSWGKEMVPASVVIGLFPLATFFYFILVFALGLNRDDRVALGSICQRLHIIRSK